MKIKKQVCSLKLAQQLKELNVKQESLWYYRILAMHPNGYRIVCRKPTATEEFIYSAFTVAELGILLPETINQNDDDSPYFLNCHKSPDYKKMRYQVRYGKAIDKNCVSVCDDTEANARAKMLIYLLENKLLEVTF